MTSMQKRYTRAGSRIQLEHRCAASKNSDVLIMRRHLNQLPQSCMLNLNSCIRIGANNRYPCQHEILHHQQFQIAAPVSVISKSGSPSCANFPFPIYLSEASVDLFANHPFVFVKLVYNHLLGLKTQEINGFDRTGSHRSLRHLFSSTHIWMDRLSE